MFTKSVLTSNVEAERVDSFKRPPQVGVKDRMMFNHDKDKSFQLGKEKET